MEDRRPAGVHPALIFVLASLFLLAHAHLYGIAFHEAAIMDDADRLADWIGGRATTEEVWFGKERPSPAKMLAAAGTALCEGPWAFRYFPALLYAWALARIYDLLRRPRGRFAAYATVSFLLLTPPLFAYSVQTSNEIVVSSFLMLGFCASARAASPREWLFAGIYLGLALGSKISAAAGIAAVGIWSIYYRPMGRIDRRAASAAAGGMFFGFWATWPVFFLHGTAPLEHITFFKDLARPATLYFGRTIEPGAAFPFVWIFLGMSPGILFLAAVEIAAVRRTPLGKLLGCFLLIGLGSAMMFHEVLREGIRHLLPMVVAVTVLAGLGLGRLAGFSRAAGALAWLIVVGLAVFSLWKTHPADSFYISELAGGPRGAVGLNMPITSSGDIITKNVLESLPEGSYTILAGRHADGALDRDGTTWMRRVEKLADRSGRAVRVTSSAHADFILILGAGTRQTPLERVILERDGVIYLSSVPYPKDENRSKARNTPKKPGKNANFVLTVPKL